MAWYNNKNPGEQITYEDWNGLINSYLELKETFTNWLLLNNSFPNNEITNLQQIINQFITNPILNELTISGPIKSNLVLDLGYISTSNTNPLALGANGKYNLIVHENKVEIKSEIEVSEFSETSDSDWILAFHQNKIKKLSFANLLNRINQSLRIIEEGYKLNVVPTITGLLIEHETNRPEDITINPSRDEYTFINYMKIDKAGHIEEIATNSIQPVISQINQSIQTISDTLNEFVSEEYNPTKTDIYDEINNLYETKLNLSEFNSWIDSEYMQFKQNTNSALEIQKNSIYDIISQMEVHALAIDDLNTVKLNISEFNSWKENTLGKPNGIATLDANGKVPLTQLPDISKQPTYVLRSTDPRPIDVVPGTKLFETDTGDSYIFDGTNWVLFADADWANVNIDWSNIINKPSEYNPAPHDHDSRYYTKYDIDSFDFLQKQTSLSNNYLIKASNDKATNSIVFDSGTNVGIGTTSPGYKLDISGTLRSTQDAYLATSSGNVGIGTTNPQAKLNIVGIGPTFTGMRIGIDNSYPDTRPRVDIGIDGWSGYIKLYNSGDVITTYITALGSYFNPPVSIGAAGSGYALYVSGTAYSTGGWQSSDLKFKKNIEEVSNALEIIDKLKPVSFEWKKDEYPEKNFPDGKRFGLIAQEVEKILPEIVNYDENNDEKSLNYVELIPWLIKAVQELKEENEKLKKEIEALKVK
ncbi:MAG: tail fiber domain-containing protein [Thermoplasmata archaeon]